MVAVGDVLPVGFALLGLVVLCWLLVGLGELVAFGLWRAYGRAVCGSSSHERVGSVDSGVGPTSVGSVRRDASVSVVVPVGLGHESVDSGSVGVGVRGGVVHVDGAQHVGVGSEHAPVVDSSGVERRWDDVCDYPDTDRPDLDSRPVSDVPRDLHDLVFGLSVFVPEHVGQLRHGGEYCVLGCATRHGYPDPIANTDCIDYTDRNGFTDTDCYSFAHGLIYPDGTHADGDRDSGGPDSGHVGRYERPGSGHADGASADRGAPGSPVRGADR